MHRNTSYFHGQLFFLQADRSEAPPNDRDPALQIADAGRLSWRISNADVDTDRLLLGPGGDDPSRANWANAADLPQAIGLPLDRARLHGSDRLYSPAGVPAARSAVRRARSSVSDHYRRRNARGARVPIAETVVSRADTRIKTTLLIQALSGHRARHDGGPTSCGG